MNDTELETLLRQADWAVLSASKQIPDRIDLDEMRQEICLRLVQAYDRFDSTKSAWATMCSRNAFFAVLDHLRDAGGVRKGRRYKISTRSFVSGASDCDDSWVSLREWEKRHRDTIDHARRLDRFSNVWRRVKLLPPPQREVVRLRFRCGWDVRRVAQHFSRSTAWVWLQQRRAIASLRNQTRKAG